MRTLRPGLAAMALSVLATGSATAGGCEGRTHAALQPFVGTWQEFTVREGGEELVGTLDFAYILDGCAIRQTLSAAESDFRFETLGHVDPETERWRETYVVNDGRFASYEWIAAAGEWIQVPVAPDRRREKRLRITQIQRDSYLVIEERSSDGGATWAAVEHTRTRRVP
jgi:hypothetical protein